MKLKPNKKDKRVYKIVAKRMKQSRKWYKVRLVKEPKLVPNKVKKSGRKRVLKSKIKYYLVILNSWFGDEALDEIINYCYALKRN
jgi:hypothetical protein